LPPRSIAPSLALVLASTLMLASRPARAEGGYYAGALGAAAAGRAGAFTAKADDLTAVAYNPAGLAKIRGTIFQVGNRFSHNAVSYTRATTLDWGNAAGGTPPSVSFAEVNNGQPWQVAEPLLGVASDLGLRDWGFALAAYAPPGISRISFPDDGGQRYQMLSREAIILNYTASAAWKLRDVFGVGATVQWIHVPRLDYSLMIDGAGMPGGANPVSSPLDIKATTRGSDPFTFNAIVGAWVRPVPALEIAVSGQVVPTDIETNSTLSVSFVDETRGPLLLTRNAGDPGNDVRVILPLPMLARFGARYRNLAADGRERWDIELDVAYETWSRVQRFRVDTNGLEATYGPEVVPIPRIDIEKRWRDTVAVSLGGDVAVIPDKLVLRGGAFYETAVADPAYANVDFAWGKQVGGAVGGSLLFGRWQLMIAYQLRVQPKVSVTEANGRVYQQVPDSACLPPYTGATCNPNYQGQPSPTINGGSYQAASHFVLLAAQYRYGL
jgi:long-chain fatty acid transport protein